MISKRDQRTYQIYNEILAHLKYEPLFNVELSTLMDMTNELIISKAKILQADGFITIEKKPQGYFKQMTSFYTAIRDFYPLDEFISKIEKRKSKRAKWGTKKIIPVIDHIVPYTPPHIHIYKERHVNAPLRKIEHSGIGSSMSMF